LVRNLVERTLEAYGRLDFAFNNAGDGLMPAPLAEIPSEDFEQVIKTTVTGTFLCMKHEIPPMIKSGGGSIVNMSLNRWRTRC
jgi:NAD(P)-dependent dehydrogenase (short-subunit alcohol dehydrogenase family)